MEGQSASINKILTIKVKSKETGRYPFDKVYVFKKELLPIAQKLTPNNLAFPIKGDTKVSLACVPLSEMVVTTLGRERESVPLNGSAYGLTQDGVKGHPSGVPQGVERNKLSPLARELVEYLASDKESDEWYQLVPILGTYKHDNAQRPAYLCSKRWAYKRSSGWLRGIAGQAPRRNPGISLTRVIPDSGHLTVEGKQHSPPCLCCTRLMNHMSGECELGGRTCLENMDFGNRSYFLEGLAVSNRLQTSSVKEVMAWLLKEKKKEDGV